MSTGSEPEVEWLEVGWPGPAPEGRPACGSCGERHAIVAIEGRPLCGGCLGAEDCEAIRRRDEAAGGDERCEECGAAVGGRESPGSGPSFGHLWSCSLAVEDAARCEVEAHCPYQAVEAPDGEAWSCARHAARDERVVEGGDGAPIASCRRAVEAPSRASRRR